ncbi:MAG: hypothetical protein QM762_02115 [Chryseolinea sp.]
MTTNSEGSSRILDIRFGSLLPWPFHVGAGLGILISIIVLAEHPWTALVFAVCSLFVFASSEGTEIDLVNRRFREYTSIFFFKTGEWVDYESMEKIYVNKNKMRQNVSPSRTGMTTSFTFMEFSAFVKFSDEETVQLIKNKDKKVVMSKAATWSKQMDVPLYDNTGTEE